MQSLSFPVKKFELSSFYTFNGLLDVTTKRSQHASGIRPSLYQRPNPIPAQRYSVPMISTEAKLCLRLCSLRPGWPLDA